MVNPKVKPCFYCGTPGCSDHAGARRSDSPSMGEILAYVKIAMAEDRDTLYKEIIPAVATVAAVLWVFAAELYFLGSPFI